MSEKIAELKSQITTLRSALYEADQGCQFVDLYRDLDVAPKPKPRDARAEADDGYGRGRPKPKEKAE